MLLREMLLLLSAGQQQVAADRRTAGRSRSQRCLLGLVRKGVRCSGLQLRLYLLSSPWHTPPLSAPSCNHSPDVFYDRL